MSHKKLGTTRIRVALLKKSPINSSQPIMTETYYSQEAADIAQGSSEFIRWLTDWIEYTP